jgi:hypothetical protein
MVRLAKEVARLPVLRRFILRYDFAAERIVGWKYVEHL